MMNEVLRIDLTVELSDGQRRDIATMVGEEGVADEKTCRAFLQASVQVTQTLATLKRMNAEER